jgi:hypothetical protein
MVSSRPTTTGTITRLALFTPKLTIDDESQYFVDEGNQII